MKSVRCVVAVGGLVAVLNAQEVQNDWLLVPGERAGPVRVNTSEADLRRLFGTTNVTATTISLGEGAEEPATAIFPKDPNRRLEILWGDPETRNSPREVRLDGAHSQWRLANGITLGTSLQELEHLNGRPFQIGGWEKEGAGIVYGWEGGALDTLFPSTGGRVWLDEPKWDLLTKAERGVLRGGSSALPGLQKTNPQIRRMTIVIGR